MLVRPSLAMLAAVLVAATPAAAKSKAVVTPPEQIECSGVFGPDSSEKLLKETFGAENVVTGTVYGPEGMELIGTTVFDDDPNRQMLFGWFDEENFTHPSYIEIAANQIAPGGVHIGQTAAEIEKLNGGPFTINGFWWDYGGYANIQKGKLANPEEPTCYLSIRFSPADEYSPAINVDPVSGDVTVSSKEGLLEILDTRVSVVTLGYDWPEDLPEPKD